MYKKSNQLNQDHTSISNMSYSEFLNKYDYFWPNKYSIREYEHISQLSHL